MSLHEVVTNCSQTIYALRVSRTHGSAVQIIFRSVVVCQVTLCVQCLMGLHAAMQPTGNESTPSFGTAFVSATDEVSKLLSQSPDTNCDLDELDPIPTPLLKECFRILLPTITNIINR